MNHSNRWKVDFCTNMGGKKIYSHENCKILEDPNDLSIKEAKHVIHTQRKTIEELKSIKTKIMETMKRKEEESKKMVAYFTSLLQELDKTCQTKEPKIDSLEGELEKSDTKNKKLSK